MQIPVDLLHPTHEHDQPGRSRSNRGRNAAERPAPRSPSQRAATPPDEAVPCSHRARRGRNAAGVRPGPQRSRRALARAPLPPPADRPQRLSRSAQRAAQIGIVAVSVVEARAAVGEAALRTGPGGQVALTVTEPSPQPMPLGSGTVAVNERHMRR